MKTSEKQSLYMEKYDAYIQAWQEASRLFYELQDFWHESSRAFRIMVQPPSWMSNPESRAEVNALPAKIAETKMIPNSVLADIEKFKAEDAKGHEDL